MRQLYRVYSTDQIGETVFSQFENLPMVDTGRRFFLICTLWIMMIFEIELDGLRVSLLILTNSDLELLLPDFVYSSIIVIAILSGLELLEVIVTPTPLNDVSNGSTFFI